MTNPAETLLRLARCYESVKQPGYPYKRMLKKLESREIAPTEFVKFKKRVVLLAKTYMKELQ